MDQPRADLFKQPPAIVRGLFALGLVVVGLIAASVLEPRSTGASDEPPVDVPRTIIVEVWGTADEPRFSVIGLTGETTHHDIPLQTVRQLDFDFDPTMVMRAAATLDTDRPY